MSIWGGHEKRTSFFQVAQMIRTVLKDETMFSFFYLLLVAACLFHPGFPTDLFQRRSVVGSPGETVTLTCSHDDDAVFYLFWYRLRKFGEPLVLVGYVYAEIINTEPQFEHRFVLNGNAKRQINLMIGNLSVEDSGVYYCCSKLHDGAKCPLPCTKTPIVLNSAL
ncbi:unnamed protein product [Arctogadus glacialis]